MTLVGRRWRCAQCVQILAYLELRQDPVTGDVFCVECWMSNAGGASPVYVVPPLVCEECLTPMRQTQAHQMANFDGTGEWATVCDLCAKPPTPEEESDVISGLLRLLEATDEEG